MLLTDRTSPMHLLPPLDIAALAFFLLAWGGYAIVVEWGPGHLGGLNARMHGYREIWMRRALARELRMFDAQIMAALQNGTAFFASTSLIAIGGGLTMLRATNEINSVISNLPVGEPPTSAQWEFKAAGLILIFVYAFFKFAWAYRLYNYVAILLGAMPPATERTSPEAERHVLRTTKLFESAGRHFNRGQRAFFFALGYLGWFAGPWPFFVSTTAVVIVIWRRQFASAAQRALIAEVPAKVPAEVPEGVPKSSP
jgi:uncharacterized membrane protein